MKPVERLDDASAVSSIRRPLQALRVAPDENFASTGKTTVSTAEKLDKRPPCEYVGAATDAVADVKTKENDAPHQGKGNAART